MNTMAYSMTVCTVPMTVDGRLCIYCIRASMRSLCSIWRGRIIVVRMLYVELHGYHIEMAVC